MGKSGIVMIKTAFSSSPYDLFLVKIIQPLLGGNFKFSMLIGTNRVGCGQTGFVPY